MLLEREGELATLNALVDHLGTEGGKVVLIRGEAGIGKSALVDAFVGSLEGRAQAITGACDDLFIPQALGPFWDMARAEPLLREPLYAGDRPRLTEALIDLISRPDRPSVVVIEDTHWADEGTFDAIRYLGRRIARTNGLLLLTYRDGEVDDDHPLRGVIGDIPPGSIARIQLAGLSVASVTALVSETGIDAEGTHQATRGNPLLVSEMALAAEGGVPGSLQDSLLGRMRRLSTGSQEMLKLLSVIPEPIPSADAMRLPGVDSGRLDECIRRGFLETEADRVSFRHDLIRRAVESSLAEHERRAKFLAVLAGLPEETHPCLIIHFAREVDDVDRLLDLAPRSARYAAAAGSHQQAAEDFREVGPHLDRIGTDERAPLLSEWAREEYLLDAVAEAIRLTELARADYREQGDVVAESRVLAQRAHYFEIAGERAEAEALGQAAIDVLGPEPAGRDLAQALEVNAYLHTMAGNTDAVPELVERTLEAGGSDIDEVVLIRSLNHRGCAANLVAYPAGRESLEEARARAESSGHWYEAARALVMQAWAAVEYRDLQAAAELVDEAVRLAARHEILAIEGGAQALQARVLELQGRWDEAADICRSLGGAATIAQMVTLPVLGMIEARRGRPNAGSLLAEAWARAAQASEYQRLSTSAQALAEYAWLTGRWEVDAAELRAVLEMGRGRGRLWATGLLAYWLWSLGELHDLPEEAPEPYRLIIDGQVTDAAQLLHRQGLPYERALALSHGTAAQQLDALENLETLGATAVAARLRKSLREQGVNVPRGKGRATRRNVAGLTARQAEVLQLLAAGMTNSQIADELFLSPRTVENHVAALLDKLDVATRAEAADRARAEGLLSDEARHT